MKEKLESLEPVHTHTHTHTSSLENKWKTKPRRERKLELRNGKLCLDRKKRESKKEKPNRKTVLTKVNLECEKGITLIALVITIIILLILTGISISMLTGENSILKNAQKAKIETEKAEVEEK